MHLMFPRSALRCVALGIVFSGFFVFAPTAATQPAKARVYATEQLRQLSEADQRRVIAEEYREQSRGRSIPDDQMRFYIDQVRLSDWTFSRIQRDIAESLARDNGSSVADGGTVRCESGTGRQQTCPTPWNTSSRLVRQLSNSPCIEGQTWSSSRGQVWVSGGCRAEFAMGWTDHTTGTGDTVRCESTQNRQQVCPTPWNTTARLVRQLSGSPCVEGRDWSSSPGQVRVDHGCRAEFAARVEHTAGNPLRCESSGNRQQTCRTPWNTASRLVRQLSETACVAGRNWSTSPGLVQVSGGCRAEFAPETGIGTGIGIGIGDEIRCESNDGRYRQCGSGLYGRPRLIRQLSDTPCREGVSWGLRDGALWVDGGCRGVFMVEAGQGAHQTVTCASENGRYTRCAWDRNLGPPRLLETLSNAPCTQGDSWGYHPRDGLWVDRGCRGRFGH